MLDKLVIHLKNIIFFQAIIYMLAITLLFNLMTLLQMELDKSTSAKEKAKGFLTQALHKLNSIVDFEEKITETNNAYHNLINNKSPTECQNKIKILKDLYIISTNYQLSEPIKMQITRLFNNSKTKRRVGIVIMKENQLDLYFSVPSEKVFIEISQDISKILPYGSIILTADLRENEALSASIIDKLSGERKPDLFKAEIKIKLREVVYEK